MHIAIAHASDRMKFFIKSILLVLLLLLSCAAVLLVAAPAELAAKLVGQQTQQKVRLIDVSGLWWNASATVLLTSGENASNVAQLPERLNWRLNWWQLPKLRLVIDLSTSQNPAKPLTELTMKRQQLAWTAFTMDLPAEVLTALGSPLNTLGLTGQMQIQSQASSLEYASGRLQGGLSLRLNQLSSRLSRLSPLGSYVIEIAPQPDASDISLQVRTVSGALLIEGQGGWQQGKFSFLGKAEPQAGYEEELGNLVGLLGTKSGNRAILKVQ